MTLWPRTLAWPATAVAAPGRRATRPAARRPRSETGSVTNASPSSGLRPGSPLHAPARSSTSSPDSSAHRLGRRIHASTPRRPARRAVPLGAMPADGPSASASRSANVLNSRKSNRRLTSSGLGTIASESKSTASSGASRRSTIRSRFLRARPSCSARLSRSLGVCLSTLAKIPSSPPYWLISLAAVFSPTPGTPGRLSELSPRSAAYCGYRAGRTPVFSSIPASS